MRNISIIFLKQLKDTLKNKAVLIQFVMLPLMAVIMENAVKMRVTMQADVGIGKTWYEAK